MRARAVLVLTTVTVGLAGLVPAAVVTATVPPGDDSGVGVIRQQAEAAANDYFATLDEAGATNVVCELPPADAAGVAFFCFAISSAGAPLLAQATVNDYGSADITAVGSGPTATTAAPTTTTSPVVSSAEGNGSQLVQINPITGPMILTVTHDGAAAFAVQPQHGGVPVGGPIVEAAGAWSGRYLTGLGGTISALAITADGSWTIKVEQRSAALAIDPAAGATGSNPEVLVHSGTAPLGLDVIYDGAGTIVVRAVTVSGSTELVNTAGPFNGAVEIPAGPAFLTVEASGAWALRPPATTAATTAATAAATTTG